MKGMSNMFWGVNNPYSPLPPPPPPGLKGDVNIVLSFNPAHQSEAFAFTHKAATFFTPEQGNWQCLHRDTQSTRLPFISAPHTWYKGRQCTCERSDITSFSLTLKVTMMFTVVLCCVCVCVKINI